MCGWWLVWRWCGRQLTWQGICRIRWPATSPIIIREVSKTKCRLKLHWSRNIGETNFESKNSAGGVTISRKALNGKRGSFKKWNLEASDLDRYLHQWAERRTDKLVLLIQTHLHFWTRAITSIHTQHVSPHFQSNAWWFLKHRLLLKKYIMLVRKCHPTNQCPSSISQPLITHHTIPTSNL